MQGKGFLATYTQVESRCGGVMRGAEGVELSTISINSIYDIYSNTYEESPRGAASGLRRCHFFYFFGDFIHLSWASFLCK